MALSGRLLTRHQPRSSLFGEIGARELSHGRILGVNEPTATKCPVLPQRLLEANHHILRIQSGSFRKAGDKVRQNLLLHFYTSTHRKKDLDQHEVLGSRRGEVWVLGIEAKIVRTELKNALKLVLLGYP